MGSTDGKNHTLAYLALAFLMTAIAIGGFWNTYWWPMLSGGGDFHWLIHLHGGIFTLWMVLLITQATMVYRGKTDLHQKLGLRVGILWGILMIIVGLSASFGRISPAIGGEFETMKGFIKAIPVPIVGIVTFAILFGTGIYFRKKPAIHKRLMILASATILFAPAARFIGLSFVDSLPELLLVSQGVPLLVPALAIGYDKWKHGRVHPAYLWGSALIVLRGLSIPFFRISPYWDGQAASIANELSSVLTPLL